MPGLPPHWRSLPRAFVHQARARRAAPAVTDVSGKDLTYGELFEHAAALGRVLSRRLTASTYVGLFVPPSVAGATANIALSLWGKVPVNLNYTTGQDQVDSAIRQCGIQQVVTSRRVIERSRVRLTADLIYLEDIPQALTMWDKLWAGVVGRAVPVGLLGIVLPGLRADSRSATATVLFTSGSTGEPKGVILSHGNILSNIMQVEVQFEPLPGEVVLGILPFFHAMGYTVTLWAVLCLGRRAVFHANPLEARVIGELCQQHGVTLLFATPTFMRHYLRRCSREQFATVRRAALGAEKLSPELAGELRQTLAIEPLEGYGCTETAPVISFNVDRDVRTPDGRSIPGNRLGTVGRPVPGTAIKTINADTGAELPAGAEGVICVKGPQVMAGYLGRPEATAKVLKDGWYITGDIGRSDEDRFLTIGGRLSRFSKVGGEMIPHEKVEDAVRTAAGVDDHALAVTGLSDARRGERLVVLYADLGGKSPEEISRILAARDIPRLWIPAAADYIKVEAIPILGNGKVDLGQLRRIAEARQGA
jgi:acyl-[acyl-carrier-protein]-phospholipid O-acyltransferase/long-chain-fatty-acid--[acyl-carrier-protein] ligase